MRDRSSRVLVLWLVGTLMPVLTIVLGEAVAAADAISPWAVLPYAVPCIVICVIAIAESEHSVATKTLLILISSAVIYAQYPLFGLIGLFTSGLSGTQ